LQLLHCFRIASFLRRDPSGGPALESLKQSGCLLSGPALPSFWRPATFKGRCQSLRTLGNLSVNARDIQSCALQWKQARMLVTVFDLLDRAALQASHSSDEFRFLENAILFPVFLSIPLPWVSPHSSGCFSHDSTPKICIRAVRTGKWEGQGSGMMRKISAPCLVFLHLYVRRGAES
jgi:hypothetical protein